MIKSPNLGILLANTGTPDTPTPKAVRRFLAEFLADPRVIEMPRFLWMPILHGIILNTRPRRSAKLYQRVWDDERGSPLLYHTQDLAEKIEAALQARLPKTKLEVAVGMRYGNPSLASGLHQLRERGAELFIILPLFPQYSNTTSGTIIAALFDELKTWRTIPPVQIINNYHDHPAYISAIAKSIKLQKGSKLLFSFHGIPQEYIEKGDPYEIQSRHTAELVAEKLALPPDAWMLSFQSRFGHQAWAQPYTDEKLAELGRENLGKLNVICPGFAVDSLETLHEIDMEGCEIFQNAGGGDFDYIPALNSNEPQVEALTQIILNALPQCA